MIAWAIFYNPVVVPFDKLLWLLAPLCTSVAVVYKTIRTHSLSRLPLEIGVLLIYMAAGLSALGAALWLIQQYWP